MSDPRKYSSNIADVSAYATYMENQLAERDKLVEDQQAEIARLQQQSVGWVRVFDENASLREEVGIIVVAPEDEMSERYRHCQIHAPSRYQSYIRPDTYPCPYCCIEKYRDAMKAILGMPYDAGGTMQEIAKDALDADRNHNDIEEARKHAAQECLDIFGTYYDEFSFADSVTEVKRKFGLEG